MSSIFALKCPKCGNIVRKSANFNSFSLYNDNFCSCCGLSIEQFSNYIKSTKTVGTEGDYYSD